MTRPALTHNASPVLVIPLVNQEEKMSLVKEKPVSVIPTAPRDIAPIDEFDSLLDRFFPTSLLRSLGFRTPALRSFQEMETRIPRIDIIDQEKEVSVKAEVPGFKKDEVEITLNDGLLTIQGQKKEENQVKEGDMVRSEINWNTFTRSLRLPTEVKADEAKASFENGILEINIPKIQATSRKTIKIE
jgi:HSP20 family protein